MTDEDEIDVLGDFNYGVPCLDAEMLGCHDCAMGSNWILDNPSWLTNPPQNEQTKTTLEAIEAIDKCNSWSESSSNALGKEKPHLDRETQLFGPNNSRLYPIVGKNQNQTKNNIKSLFLQSSSSESNNNPPLNLFTEYFDDTQIPASFEEVITAVKTGEPTISSIDKQQKNENRQKKLNKSDRKTNKKSENNIKIRKKLLKPDTDSTISNQLFQNSHFFPGGEVVWLAKDQHIESDEPIDVDIDEDEDLNCLNKIEQSPKNPKENIVNPTPEIKEKTIYLEQESNEKESTPNHILTSHDIFDKIYEIPPPSEEVVLDPGSITKEEKEINYDFFKGSTAKTFERYLKIRNHIINRWKYCKPEYLSKTSARAGLRQCGDVNCIGRIHTYLEQIGAINFNCAQAKYTKSIFNVSSTDEIKKQNKSVRLEEPRRKKRILEKSSTDYFNAGGYTIQHEENGDMKIISPKNITKPKKQTEEKIRLIKCKNFEEFQVPFLVKLHLDALIVMDFHSHLCHSEVIGLLGGFFDEEENVLHLTKAQPCKSKSTQVHCEMCPVSQSEASIQLQAAGLDVVGWYHSHPTFFPNPSIQDISTQNDMQQYFQGAPFVSFILSPFCQEEYSLASIFRCLIVKEGNKTTNFEFGIPYRFNVKITGISINLDALFKQLENIYLNESSLTTNHVIMQDNYQPNITYYQKCLRSVSEHINKADSITNFIKEKILTNLKRIFTLSR